MRITSSSAAIVLLASLATASNNPIPLSAGHESRFGLGAQRHFIIPYGGDADASDATAQENANANGSTEKSKGKTTSSKLLSTVSAGGAFHSEAAFIGTKTRVPQTRSPPYGLGENYRDDSASSLSVATNHQQEVNTVEDTSSDEESTVVNDKPLRSLPRKNGPLKILFLSSDTGGGHRASAEALANQFQRLYPGTTYDLFDVWTDVETSWPY